MRSRVVCESLSMTEFAPVPDDVLRDLRSRLERYRSVDVSSGSRWERGVDHDYLAHLIDYWAVEYDWREHERRIAALPWTDVLGTAIPLRVIHATAGEDAPTVVLIHGWPDSVLRFDRLLPLLADVNVVVPALPGFPFALPGPGMSSTAMADVVGDAMDALGYSRYVVSAGDVGCDVAEALAARRPHAVSALHLTDVSQYHFLHDLPTDLSPAEQAYVEYGHRWQAEEGGYMHEQGTRPSTVAVGLGDSPAGLASWILEKLRLWTDCGGEIESAFSRDELLTWITAYWVYGCIGTSFTAYAEAGGKPWGRITAPTAFTVFPRDLVNAPREFADRFFTVRDWRELDAGGHFGAWEHPRDYERGVRTAVGLASTGQA
jgi:pimeloyl-ACP methyl ester carboxylesterase